MAKLRRNFTAPGRLRRRKDRHGGPGLSSYPKPSRDLAGKWVAWAGCRIVASGDTLAGVVASVEREGIKGASFERLPALRRAHAHVP